MTLTGLFGGIWGYLADLGKWVGKYNEQIKIVFVVVAALWVLIEYKHKQEEARIERTIDYIKRSSMGELLAAEVKMTQYWTNKATDQRVNALPKQDKKAYADFIVETVERSLTTEVWQMFNFYKSLAICVNARLCDPTTACIRFQRDIKIFIENYGPYFEHYHAKYHDDALRPIRTLLAQKTCTSSELDRQGWVQWVGDWWN
jgi:hypothetical protein